MSDFLARIKPKKSSTAGERPTALDLRVGELAINTADGKIYTKHTDGQIVEMVGTGTGGGGGGGGISGGTEDLIDVDPKRGQVAADSIPRWKNDSINGYPETLAEFDAVASSPGAWFYTNEFPGIADPQFFLGQFVVQGTAIDYSGLPASGTLYAEVKPANWSTSHSDEPVMLEWSYTNLSVRGNQTVTLQIDEAFLNLALENLSTEESIREGSILIWFDGEPITDVPASAGEALIVQENGNYKPTELTTQSLTDMPTQADIDLYKSDAELNEDPLVYYSNRFDEYRIGFPSQLYQDKSAWQLSYTNGYTSGVGELLFPEDEQALQGLYSTVYTGWGDDGVEPAENYVAIPLDSNLTNTIILGKRLRGHLFVTLTGRIGIWFDNINVFRPTNPSVRPNPDHFGETYLGDCLITAGNLDLYWAMTEKPGSRVRYASTRTSYITNADSSRTYVQTIRLDISWERCDLDDQFCGIACFLQIHDNGNFTVSYGMAFDENLLEFSQWNFSDQNYRGLVSDGKLVVGGGLEGWADGLDDHEGTFTVNFYTPGKKINNYIGADLESLGDVGTYGGDYSPGRFDGNTIRWNSVYKFWEYKDFTAEDIVGYSDEADGDMVVRDSSNSKGVSWQKPVREFHQLLDTPLEYPTDSAPHSLVTRGNIQTWESTTSLESVSSVNGQQGDVSLSILDLNDVEQTKVQTVGSWNWTASSDAAGDAYLNAGESAIFLNETDADGSSFRDAILYLIDEAPVTMTFKGGDGAILYKGTVDGPISYSRGKFRLYPTESAWISQLTPGDRLEVSLELPGAALVPLEQGDVVIYNGEKFVTGALSFTALEDVPTDFGGGIEEAPVDGKQYARKDEAWAEVAAAYDDTAISDRVTTLEGEVATLQGDVTTLQGDVTTLEGEVTTLQSDVTTLEGEVTTLQSEVTTLQGEVTTLQGEVATLQGEVTTIQAELLEKIEEAPEDGTAYVRQDGQWLSLSAVLAGLGFVPGGGGTTPDIPEIVNGGNFTTGEAGSVDLVVSGGNFTTGAAGSADELVDGGVFTSDVVIPETVDGGDFTTGQGGSVDVVVSGGDFTTGQAGSADELVDGGVFTSDVVIPEVVNGGDFTTGDAGSADVTVSGGDFTTGEAGSIDETVDGGDFSGDVVIPETVSGGDFTTGTGGSADVTLGGGDFTSGAAGPNDETVDGGAFAPESVSGGDFTSGGSAGPDTTYGGGDFTSGDSSGQNITLDGGVFTSGDDLTAGGGDFTSGGSGGPDVTYGGGDFATGSGGSQDVTLDGGDFGGPAASGGDFTSGEGGDDDATYGAGDFTTGQAFGDDVTLDGGDFSAEGGGDFTTGASGGAAITYGAGDFSSGESSGAAITLDGGDFSS